jgi:hypothetical protein
MARFSAGGVATIAGTSLRFAMSVYAVAAWNFRLRECGIFNTTSTAAAFALGRATTAGTQGSAMTEATLDTSSGGTAVSQAQAFNGHTADLGSITHLGYNAQLGAAVGSGIVWVFGDTGISVPAGTANGVGVYVPTGTGQVCNIYFVWDE